MHLCRGPYSFYIYERLLVAIHILTLQIVDHIAFEYHLARTPNSRGRSRLLKRGEHSQTYHHVDVGLARICTVIVWEAHKHAKHANTKGAWGHAPPGNFEKLHSLRLNLRAFLVIDHPLMLLWIQVHEAS